MQLSHALWVVMLAVTVQGCSKKPLDPCPQDACSGHGTCYAGPNNRPMCECEPGYEDVGLTCVANCFAVDCSNLGGCLVQDNEPVCVCDQGYQGVGLECRPAPQTCHEHRLLGLRRLRGPGGAARLHLPDGLRSLWPELRSGELYRGHLLEPRRLS